MYSHVISSHLVRSTPVTQFPNTVQEGSTTHVICLSVAMKRRHVTMSLVNSCERKVSLFTLWT